MQIFFECGSEFSSCMLIIPTTIFYDLHYLYNLKIYFCQPWKDSESKTWQSQITIGANLYSNQGLYKFRSIAYTNYLLYQRTVYNDYLLHLPDKAKHIVDCYLSLYIKINFWLILYIFETESTLFHIQIDIYTN